MDRQIAESAISIVKRLDALFAELDELTHAIENDDEVAKIRRGVGNAVSDIHEHVIVPICRQYPALDPDKKI